MKTPHVSRSRGILCLAIVGAMFVFRPGVQAQPVVNPGSSSSKNRLGVVKGAFEDGALLAAGGNLAQAEAVLGAANVAKPGTAGWHVETAQRLFGLALYFRQQHAGETARQLGQRALSQIELAKAGRATPPGEQARALQLGAMIHDRVMGDIPSALNAYREALRLNPVAAYAAAEVDRLTIVQAEITRQDARK